MKYLFYDTCSLLLKNNSLFEDQNEKPIISSITINELEGIKTSINKDETVRAQARAVLRQLNDNIDKYEIVLFNPHYLEFIDDSFDITNDLKILACANYYNLFVQPIDYFITNDLILKQLALMYFKTAQVKSIGEDEDDYTGFIELYLNDIEIANFYNNYESLPIQPLLNQYIILKNTNGEVFDYYKYTKNGLEKIAYPTFNSYQFGQIKPKDVYQLVAMDSMLQNKVTLIGGHAGTGKAQPNSTLIPTKNGKIKLGDIKPGDKILDRVGEETTVLAVYPQGLKDNYKITFSDGRISYCNNEHLWSCYTSKGNLKTLTVQEMLETGLQSKSGEWKYKIPTNNAVEFPEKKYSVDPYVVGAFIGDGCCAESALTFSSSDEEIVKEIATLIDAKEYYKSSEKNYNWNFYLKDEKQYTFKNNLGEFKVLRFLTKDLFKDIPELVGTTVKKRIPEKYKYGSINQRFSLLQGLMDTDGTIDNVEKGRTRFTSINLDLIKDVQEICWSLGFSASITEDNRSEKYKTGICYTLSISCPKHIKPLLFRLKRKKDIAIGYSQNNKKSIHAKGLTIKSIEKMSQQEEMTCLLVDNKEHLYLTEQYIVTHNTFLALSALFHLMDKNVIDRIVVFCNPVVARGAAKLGF